MMITKFLQLFLLQVLNVGLHEVLGVNLYVAENPLSTDSLELRVVNISRRNSRSPLMPEYYVVEMGFGGRQVNASLKRQDGISSLVGHRRVYQRDWATYASDDVDGVFIVHRHKPKKTGLMIEGYMIHDMTPYLVQPCEKSDELKHRSRRDASLLDGKALYMKAKVIVDVKTREFVRSRVGEAETNSIIEQYYSMMVNFINRRFASLRKFGLHIYFKGMGITILSTPIPGVGNSHRVPNDPEQKTMCSQDLLDKFILFTKYDKFDQVILLTGYEMLSPDGIPVTKFATIDNGCKEPGARSIVYFDFRIETFQRAAHAIMKGFGVKNDGERGDPLAEKCPSSMGYIMSVDDQPYFSPFTSKIKWWLYSRCTYEMLRRYLMYLDKDRSRTCMRYMESAPLDPGFLGFKMNLDQQCHFFAGPESYAHKDSFLLQNICADGLTCLKPTLIGRELRITKSVNIALPGTRCAEGKVCYEKQCIPRPMWLTSTSGAHKSRG